MTEGKDEYYRPWLDSIDDDPASPKAPTGIDKAVAEDQPGKAPQPKAKIARATGNKASAQAQMVLGGAKKAWAAFADTTIWLGEKADVPRRVEALHLGDKARNVASAASRITSRAGRAGADAASKAGRGSAQAIGRLGKATGKVISAATASANTLTRDGIDKSIQLTKAGSTRVTESAKGAATPMIERVIPPKPETPQLGKELDRLVASESDAVAATDKAASRAADLPLFGTLPADADEPETAPAAAAANEKKRVVQRKTVPAVITKTAVATNGIQKSGADDMDESSDKDAKNWRPVILGVAAIAVLAAAILAGSAFWGRSGSDNAAGADGYAPDPIVAAMGDSEREAMEAVVRNYILEHPEIIPEALTILQRREMAAAIDSLRETIETPFAGAWGGNADGDVVLVEYSDYACSFCRQSLRDVEQLIRADPNVKVVYRELPILTAQSGPAAKVSLAAARKGKYRDFHLALFALGQPSEANILAAAQKAGMSADDVEDAIADPALDREIATNFTVMQQLRFEGTPAFVVGDQILQGAVGYEALKAAVEKARKEQ